MLTKFRQNVITLSPISSTNRKLSLVQKFLIGRQFYTLRLFQFGVFALEFCSSTSLCATFIVSIPARVTFRRTSLKTCVQLHCIQQVASRSIFHSSLARVSDELLVALFLGTGAENSQENIAQKDRARSGIKKFPLLKGQRALTGEETSGVSLLAGAFLMHDDCSTIAPRKMLASSRACIKLEDCGSCR